MTFIKRFDSRDAHLLPKDTRDCAIKLAEFNRWRRGDESLTQPNPHEIGAWIDFACDVMSAMHCHDYFMVIAATRYCLGRTTYITSECTSWLIKIWPLLSEQARNLIKRDIEEAFCRDDADRAAGRQYKALGHDCDRHEWSKVRKLWEQQK